MIQMTNTPFCGSAQQNTGPAPLSLKKQSRQQMGLKQFFPSCVPHCFLSERQLCEQSTCCLANYDMKTVPASHSFNTRSTSGSGHAMTRWYKVELDAVVITFGSPPHAEIRIHNLANGNLKIYTKHKTYSDTYAQWGMGVR
jgi:hypothetical protein